MNSLFLKLALAYLNSPEGISSSPGAFEVFVLLETSSSSFLVISSLSSSVLSAGSSYGSLLVLFQSSLKYFSASFICNFGKYILSLKSSTFSDALA